MYRSEKFLYLSRASLPCYSKYSSTSNHVRLVGKRRGKLFTLNNINPSLHEITKQVKAWEVALDLKKFTTNAQNLIKANVGDAQSTGVRPITFVRQVLACVTYPELMNSTRMPKDVVKRAKRILEACTGNTIGCYSPVGGLNLIRQHCAEFITKRDNGIVAYPENILILNGATEAIASVFQLFNYEDSRKTGVMIPTPQYPLYSSLISEYKMSQINYYLSEEQNWAIDTDELEKSYLQAVHEGTEPKVIVIINPGNPTGQVLTRENIEKIIDFAYRHDLFIMADEVYQDNVYDKSFPFHSFKKILAKMGSPYDNMELASFHSASKGYLNECGLRSGYVELYNFETAVLQSLITALSIKMCSTVLGQIGLDCMVDPPDLSEESYELWHKEKSEVLSTLKIKAAMFEEGLNSIPGISCNHIQGSMFAFPRIDIPQKAIDRGKKLNIEPDFLYTTQLLKQEGVSILPGSTFGQTPGTYHFRTSILPDFHLAKEMLRRIKVFHGNFIKDYE